MIRPPKFRSRILPFAGRVLASAALLFVPTLHNRALADVTAIETAKTKAVAPLAPGAIDGRIAYWVAALLGSNQYSAHSFDREISEKFFYRYLDALDPQRLHFLESDVLGFDHYRTNLDRLTMTTNRVGDVSPAFEIFNRFLQRLEQRVVYCDDLLKKEKFEFNDNERMLLNRHDAPYPKDLTEAKALWRQRLRYEYLQEVLGRTGPKKTNEPPAAPAAPQPGKKSDAQEITDLLTGRYNRALHGYQGWVSGDVVQVYLTALAHVYDPHSDYFNKQEAENFAITMNLSLFGIGAELTSEEGYCTIHNLVKNGPAIKSKQIKPRDRIVAVAQADGPPVDVVDMNLDKVVQMIRGPKGTEVRLTIMPADTSDRRVVSLIRDEIKLEDKQAKADVIEIPSESGKTLRLGVIDLPAFYAPINLPGVAAFSQQNSLTRDVAKLLTTLKREKVDGVILDLRWDGGGSLEEAIRLTGLFIKDGPVVLVKQPDGQIMQEGDMASHTLYTGPLIVLTSRYSASASEIFAAALQDYGRALIVGDICTHGKGTVQNLNPLTKLVPASVFSANDPDPGELKITISKFYRVSGASTQREGVRPDVVLPSVLNYVEDMGEKALDNALPYDTISPSRYQTVNMVEPSLGELLRRSNDRIATNVDFGYVREDIDTFRKKQADKTISLNLAERLKEKEDAADLQKTRGKEIKERFARNPPITIVHNLTLKDVDLPGLPPPAQKTNKATASTMGPDADTNRLAGRAVEIKTATNAGGNLLSGQGTNTDSAAATANGSSDDEHAPAVDTTLEETERILTDYISLLATKGKLSETH